MQQHPESTEDLLLTLPQPIAVIGNGIIDQALGKVIDRYPTVIRINNFRLEGYEDKVGSRTTLRCTSGWIDIEARGCSLEISPFTYESRESEGIPYYIERSSSTLLTAQKSVHELLPSVPNPSTGLALLALLSSLGISVSAFGFDGFQSGHYWSPQQPLKTTHSKKEFDAALQLKHVTVYGKSYPYEDLYNYCHEHHTGYNINEGLALLKNNGICFSGEKILEFGAGNGELSSWLQKCGNDVTAIEVSKSAFEKIPLNKKIHGDTLTLCQIEDEFDRLISMDVLEHLTENDIKIFAEQAHRLASQILITISTRPSGLLGPNGENLHLTVRSAEWWRDVLSQYFKVFMTPGIDVGQIIVTGERLADRFKHPLNSEDSEDSEEYPKCDHFELPQCYQPRSTPAYYEDSPENNGGVTWQPDVYSAAAQIGRSLNCRTIIDIGCGHAGKLKALKDDFKLIGVDYGPNIAHCRTMFPFGIWLESNLEEVSILPIPNHTLYESVIICSDVIEHLRNPKRLLQQLKRMLEVAPALVLSTPDRVLTHGATHAGPPPNPAHIREWSKDELERLLNREGFSLATITHTRSNDASNERSTILAVAINPAHPALRGSRWHQ